MKNKTRDGYYQTKTPLFKVPVVFNPNVEVIIGEKQPYEGLLNSIAFKQTTAGGDIYPIYSTNDFRLFFRLVNLYEALRKISPQYFERNFPPSDDESLAMAETIKVWMNENAFPIMLHGYEYNRTDGYIPSNLKNCYEVISTSDRTPSIIQASQFMQSLIYIVEISGFAEGKFDHNIEDYYHYYHGRVELSFDRVNPIYYAEDVFAAVKAQVLLFPPLKDRWVTCKNCGEHFYQTHGHQQYCDKLDCNPHTHYNKSEKGIVRNKKAKAKKEGES